MGKMETFVRPLSRKEQRLLSAQLTRLRKLVASFQRRTAGGLLIVGGVLASVTAIATWKEKGSLPIVIVLWLGICAVLHGWERIKTKPKLERQVSRFEQALARNEGHVVRIQSEAVVEFAELQDEGPCYAFQLDGGRIVFLSGPGYPASTTFPSTDFSLVRIYDAASTLIEEFMEKDGSRLNARRRIPGNVKAKLKMPDHLKVLEGSLDELEKILAP